MKYIKNLSEYLFERLDNIEGRRLWDLVLYFDKPIEEKEKELPQFFDNHYPNIFEEWCMENANYFLDDLEEYDSEDEAYDNIIYPTTHYELMNYPDAERVYREFLINIVDNIFNNNTHNLDLHLLPLYITYNHEGDIEDDWMVHFTEEEETQKKILDDQYFCGIPNMYNLAISAGNEEDWDKDGYCFAFDLNNVYYNFQHGYSHYGNYGILFKASGIQLYHNGDNEIQTIFIGDQATNMIPFYYDEETKEFYNKDNNIRTDEIDDFFDELKNEITK